MSDTANLALPLVQASQAQKHVTVNEALARLDAMSQLIAVSRDTLVPPDTAADGTAYIVPPGASGPWTGETARIAVFSNEGWVFLSPKAGWRAWLADRNCTSIFDGAEWIDNAAAISSAGAASVLEIVEHDVSLTEGASFTTVDLIPAHSIVFGISGIVTSPITGTLGSWRLGVSGAEDRYGSGIGLSLGAWLQGLTGQPQAYYQPTPLVLTAEGGAFSAGTVRLALHFFRMRLPRV